MSDLTPFAEFQEHGYRDTEREVLRLNRIVASDYRRALDDIRRELEALYAKVLSGVPPENMYNEAIKFRRLAALQRRVEELYVRAAVAAGDTTAAASRVAISNNFYRQQFAVKFAADFVNPVMLAFGEIDDAAIRVSVFGTPEVWADISKRAQERIEATFGSLSNYQPQHGTLTDVLVRNRQEDLLRIRQTITQGLIQGKPYAQTASRITDTMNTSVNKALRIVRTETNRNMNAGHYAASNYAKSEGVGVRRMIVATLDDATRAQSAGMDGQFENEQGRFTYPNGATAPYPGMSGVARYDINDRETVVDVIPDAPPELRRGRVPGCEGGRSECTELFSYEAFPEWAKKNGLERNKYGELLPQGG